MVIIIYVNSEIGAQVQSKIDGLIFLTQLFRWKAFENWKKNSSRGHTWWKIGLFGGEKNPNCDCSRSNQMPSKDKKKQRFLLPCEHISELTPNLSWTRDLYIIEYGYYSFRTACRRKLVQSKEQPKE